MTVSKVSGVARGVGIALHGGVTGSAGTAGIDATIRTFIDLDDVLNSRYLITTPISFSGNFTIRVKFATTESARAMGIIDLRGTTSGTFGTPGIVLGYNGAGALKLWYEDATQVRQPVISSNGTTAGKLHMIEIINVAGDNLSVKLDGVTVLSGQTPVANGFSLTQVLGAVGASNFFNGIEADVEFIDQSGAEDVTTSFGLDQATGNVEYSDENTFGAELWSDPATSIGVSWTDNGNGSYTRVAGGSNDEISETVSAIPSGAAVAVTLDLDYAGGTFNVRVQGGVGVTLPTSTGTHTVICIAGASGTTRVRASNANAAGTFSDITFKEIQGNAVTYVNIPESNREEFQLGTGQWDNISPPTQVLPAVLAIA